MKNSSEDITLQLLVVMLIEVQEGRVSSRPYYSNVISQAREIVEDVITSPKGNRKVKVSLVK